jgi:hypothetical protein
MKVKDLTLEAHVISNHQGNSMELDFKNDFHKLKLIKDKVDPFDNKVYQGDYVFYLTDENDKYLGHLEYEPIDANKIMITTSFSKQRGFYDLLFKLIIVKTPFKYIFGGYEQTESAVGSWKKVMSRFTKKVYNTKTKHIEDFDDSKENEYWIRNTNNPLKTEYLVGLTEHYGFDERFARGEKLLETRRSLGRSCRTPHDILVRFYGIDPEDSEEMVKMYPCE